MPVKNKKNQSENLFEVHPRDLFQTPAYATNLLFPFIPKYIKNIWECACGDFKITEIFEKKLYNVYSTDLKYGGNFLETELLTQFDKNETCIVTNPPFSLKKRFYQRCLYHKIPFALLIPTDYSKWIIDAIRFDKAEKIIPTSRINYITPNTIKRINQRKNTVYTTITEIPNEYIAEDFSKSSSQFHSMWLTWGFELGKSEIFVELTKEMMNEV